MRRRGFSLVEISVVLVITALLAAMSLSAYGKLKNQASFNVFGADLTAQLNEARNRASLDQKPVVVVFLGGAATVQPRYVVFEDVDSDFNASTFDPTQPIAAPDVPLYDETAGGTIAWGPSTGFGGNLPAPFDSIPATTTTSFPSTASSSAPYTHRAILIFNGDGSLTLDNGARGGSISLYDTAAPARELTVAFVAPTGTVRGFSK